MRGCTHRCQKKVIDGYIRFDKIVYTMPPTTRSTKTTRPARTVLPIKFESGFYQELKFLSEQTSRPMAEIIRQLIKEPVLQEAKKLRQFQHQSLAAHAAKVAFQGSLHHQNLSDDELVYTKGVPDETS